MEKFLERISRFWRPHPGQLEFLLAKAKTKVLACGRRWGKTDACAIQIIESIDRGPPNRNLIVAPTRSQTLILFERIVELLARIFPDRDRTIRLSPFPRLEMDGSIVVARSAHVPRTLRGMEADSIVVDEAAYVADRTIHEVLWPMMATTDGTMTLISTPKGLNGFWRLFQNGQRGDPGFWSRRGPSEENPSVRKEFLEGQRLILDASSYETEYEALFHDADGATFPTLLIDDAMASWDGEVRGQVLIGIDWGRHRDYTAVAVVIGDRTCCSLVRLERFNQMEWRTMVERVASIVRDYDSPWVLSDSTGIGDSLLEMYRESDPTTVIEGFTFNSANKAKLIEGLTDLFQRRTIHLPADSVLRRELSSFQAVRSQGGNLQYAASGTEHDDTVIALALACYQLRQPNAMTLWTGDERRF